MNTKMLAKFVISSVLEFKDQEGNVTSERLQMNAVGGNSVQHGYPQDGSDEDNTFARYTPSAYLDIYIQNPELFGKFKQNDKLYVDFTTEE